MIATTNAAANSEGFIRRRSTHYVTLDLNFGGKSIRVYPEPKAMHPSPPLASEFERPRESLELRAWTLQEHFLSQRSLHFSGECMYCECLWSQVTENGITYTGKRKMEALVPRKGKDLRILPSGHERPTRYTSWYFMVEEYMVTNLTRGSDKLPAPSGMASRVAQHLPDQYCAGIWRSELEYGLKWRADQGRCRPQKWRAPMWSWASLDAPVQYPRTGDIACYRKPTQISLSNIHITPTAEDRFGALESFYYSLRHPLSR